MGWQTIPEKDFTLLTLNEARLMLGLAPIHRGWRWHVARQLQRLAIWIAKG